MEFKILQQNLNQSGSSELAQFLLEKAAQADLVFLSEYSSPVHEAAIGDALEKMGFQLHNPLEDDASERNKFICVLAAKKGLRVSSFEQNKALLKYRYFSGSIEVNGAPLNLFLHHAPQTYIPSKPNKPARYYQERMEFKAQHLFAAFCFALDHPTRTLIGGDFNTETNGSTTTLEPLMKRLYRQMCDTTSHEPTWNGKCLDYAFVSPDLKEAGAKTETLGSPSDHKALLTTLFL